MVYRVLTTFNDPGFPLSFGMPDVYALAPVPAVRSARSASTLTPRYSYRSSSDARHLEVELPGVAREHIVVELDGSRLRVHGKRFRNERGSCCVKHREAEGGKEPVVMERYLLALRLGKDADTEGVKAEHCGNGVLVITIPVKQREVKKIEIG